MNKWTSSLDANHKEIVKLFKSKHAEVIDTSKVGDGFPDLIVKVGIVSAFVEIKVEGGALSPKQQKWHAEHSAWLVFMCQNEVDVDWIIAKLLELQGVTPRQTHVAPAYVCPHGFTDSDLCPMCCH